MMKQTLPQTMLGLLSERQLVPQIVKAKLVSGSISDVGIIRRCFLYRIRAFRQQSGRQAQNTGDTGSQLKVSFRQVHIGRNHMHASPGHRQIQRSGQCDKRFSFTGLHLSNTPA